MIKLLSYLKEDNILEFSGSKEAEVLKTLFKQCLKEHDDKIQAKAMEILAAKKNNKCLNLNKIFALTHIRIDEINDIKVAVGVFSKPAKIGRSKNVRALFCIAIPAGKCQAYLSFIAHLTRLLSEKEAEKTFRIGNKKGILEFIRQFENS